MQSARNVWMFSLLAASALAQTPPPARTSGAQPPLPTLQLSSPAWHDGGPMPLKYTQAGHDVSPQLSWSQAPQGTESFVIMVHDMDAATAKGDEFWLSWLVWNIPKTNTSLPEGMVEGGNLADGMRQISDSGPYYRGPVGPHSDPPHHFVFEIYALSATLNVPAVMGQSAVPVRTAIQEAMQGKVLAKGVLVGTFQRP
jgi:hypothetical protein